LLSLARLVVASLLLGLSTTTFAAPWRILAKLDREGNGAGGPSELEDTFSGPGDKIVSVSHIEGFSDNSEIIAHARVDLATGAMRGSAHAVAKTNRTEHLIRFISVLEEEISITFPSALPVADRFVRVHANVNAGFAADNVAIANGIFVVEVNSRRGAVSFGTNIENQWRVIDQDIGVTTNRTSGGQRFTIALPNGTNNLSFDAQLEGTARAFGRIVEGPGIADVIALNTAYLELEIPAGATFTSGSGVFLTQAIPEPSMAVLIPACACALAIRRRRALV
jgi:hypothetical protein